MSGKSDLDRISLDDIASEASRWGLNRDRALSVADELVTDVRSAVSEVVDHDELATQIAGRADRLLESRQSR